MFFETGSNQPQWKANVGVSTATPNLNWQFFRDSTILVCQDHVSELRHLSPELQH
jgi:hypothetical protein